MIRRTLRRNSSVAVLILLALGSLAVGWWLRQALSERTETASAGAAECRELVRTFDAYPLVYLGDSFEGLPLEYCVRRQSAAIADRNPATDRFVFVYGSCTIEPGQSSCPAPLQVSVFPRCDPPFESGAALDTIRGSEAKTLGAASLLVESEQYSVVVSSGTANASDAAFVRRALLELRGANPLAARLTASKPLADPALIDSAAADSDACSSDTQIREPSLVPTQAPAPPQR